MGVKLSEGKCQGCEMSANCPGGGKMVRWGRSFFGVQGDRGTSAENVRISVQDYRSVRTPVMICTTVVNTHTHTQTDRHMDSF